MPKQLRVESDPIEITSLSGGPDTKARWTDDNGHTFWWIGPWLVNVKWVEIDRYWCPDCRDDHVDENPVCVICGELVKIPTRSGMFRDRIPGPVRYYVDDDEVTPEEFEEVARAQGHL